MHQKQVAKEFVALAFIFLMALCTIHIHRSNASKKIVVPENYPSISAAVDNASPNEVIFVKSGVYYENLLINKSLTLIGEDSKNTILIGTGGIERGQNTVVTLAADHVKISGFTIESLNYSIASYHASGISIKGDNCTIAGNIIRNTYYGIFCSSQSSITISENNITSNLKDGVRFCGGSLNKISKNSITENTQSGIAIEGYSNTIARNKIKNNGRGIGIGSSHSLVFGNNLNGNDESGLYFVGSNNIVSANKISENKWGIYFTPYFAAPNENQFYHNNFADNEVNIGGSSPYNIQFWDSGYPSGGNYWSDYKAAYPNAAEVEASGIGDLPYVIDSNNTDNYPLLAPFDILDMSSPSATPPPTAKPNSFVALWPFDKVEPNGVTPDETGLNSAVVGSTVRNVSYTPRLVDGEFGKALSFDGTAYVSVPISPSLEITGEITIDAWINVQQFKDVEYNNIVVEAARSRASLPERTVGLAVNGHSSGNGTGIPVGALKGYVTTEDGVLNEIVITKSVIALNQWTHVVFTRSLKTGMHIHVNGEEQSVTVTSGVLNPQGAIKRETELYIGHDAICFIDEVRISNTAQEPTCGQFLWMQWWFWAVAVATGLGVGLFFYCKKHKH
jgi:parallel beta-helix repeat protein